MRTLRVAYSRASELRQDLDGQLCRGGLLVQVSAPPDMQLHGQVVLEIVMPDGKAVRGQGEILHIQPGGGVAVTFPAAGVAELRELLGPPAPDRQGATAARHEIVEAGAPAPEAPPAAAPARPTPPAHPAPEGKRLEQMSSADKIQLALHGNKDERTALLRDKNRMLHPYVLRNPQISPEEILAIAKTAQTAPELLQQIAERKEWLQRGTIAVALVRNPKTPQGAGIRALEFVAMGELRQLAKGGAPPHIVQAARKKVLTP